MIMIFIAVDIIKPSGASLNDGIGLCLIHSSGTCTIFTFFLSCKNNLFLLMCVLRLNQLKNVFSTIGDISM